MLAQKLIFSYINQIVIQIFQIAASLVVARIAGPGVLGTLAFGLSYVTMFSFVADLGFGTAHIKKLSEGMDPVTGLGTFSRIKIALTGLYAITVIAFFLIQKYVLGTKFESSAHVWVIFIFLASAIISQFYSIGKTTFQAYTQQVKTDIPDFITALINQSLRIVIVIAGFRSIMLAFGNLASVIMILPFYLFLFRGYKIGPYHKDVAKEYLKISAPVMITAITSTLYSSIGIVLLQFFTDSTQVGFYSAGFRIGGFVLLISLSIGTLFFPVFSKAASNKDFETIKKHVDKFERFSFIYLLPLLIIITIFSSEIVRLLLGKEFSASIPIMIMINFSMFFRVLSSPYGSLIAGLGLFRKGVHIGLIHLAFYLICLVILVNNKLLNLSGSGAALAYLLSTILFFILNIAYARKNLKVLTFSNLYKYLAFGIINFVISYLIFRELNPSGIILKSAFVIAYLVITYLAMYTMKLVTKDDLQIAKTLLDFGAMRQYINKEIRHK